MEACALVSRQATVNCLTITIMSNSPHWLDLSEYLANAVAVVGVIAAVSSGTWAYAALPLLLCTLISAINRWRLNQNLRLRSHGLELKLSSDLQQQGEVLQQEIVHARSFATALVKQMMAAQTTDPKSVANRHEVVALAQKLDSHQQLMHSMQSHVAGVEGSLHDVVDLLEGTALTDRVEHLERQLTLMSQRLGIDPADLLVDPVPQSNFDRDQPEIDLMPLLDLISEDFMSVKLLSGDLGSGDFLLPGELSGDIWDRPIWHLHQTLSAHNDWVRCLSFTPDGTHLVSGSFDKTIKLWQLSTGKLIHTLTDHPKGVFALAISPDGKLLASGSWDDTIKLWNLETGTLVRNLSKHQGSVRSLAISADSRMLVSGSFDRTIELWQLPDGVPTQTIVTRKSIAAIALSADGRLIASTSENGNIVELWSLASGKLIAQTVGNNYGIGSLAIAPDSQTIAAGTVNGYLILWQFTGLSDDECQQIEPLQSIEAHAGQINACVFSPDGQHVITGSVDGKAKVWYKDEDLSFRNPARNILKGDLGRSVMSVAIASDGRSVAVGGADGTIQIWQQV